MRIMQLGMFWCFSVFALALVGSVSGQDASNWTADIANARATLKNVEPAAAASAKAKLQSALGELEALLKRSGEETELGWKEYLNWPALSEAAVAEQPDLKVLRSVYSSLRAKHEGLEMRQFTSVRDALWNYLNLQYYSTLPDQAKVYNGLLDTVEKILATPDWDKNQELFANLGLNLGVLETAGQAKELIAKVRSKYSQPNLLVRVTGDFIARNTKQAVDDTTDINEEILGTHQTGTAHTVGTVWLRPVANSKKAQLRAEMSAVTSSVSVGRKDVGPLGQIVINSQGETTVAATKEVMIDDLGLAAWDAVACCDTNTTICGICAPRLVARIASRMIYAQKGEAEAVASQRAARKIEARFDERVAESLGEANKNFTNEFRKPLIRLDALPHAMNFSTTDDALWLNVIQSNGHQLALGGAAPELPNADVAMVAHESALSNLAEAVLAGKTINDEQVAELVESTTGDLPQELQINREDPWKITFASTRPLLVSFKDDLISLRLRGSRFEGSSGSVKNLIEIVIDIKIEKTEKGVRISKVKDVEINFPGFETLDTNQLAVQSFLKKKLTGLLPEPKETEGLKFPGRFEDKKPLHLTTLSIQQGWVHLGWTQEAE